MKKFKTLLANENSKIFDIFIIIILVVAFFLRFPGIFSNITGDIKLYVNSDESGILYSTFNIIRTADFNPQNFTYPSLLIYLEVIFQVALYIFSIGTDFYIRPFEQNIFPAGNLYAMGRFLNVILGTITIAALYLVARQLTNKKTAILTSALLAVTFAHVWSSQYAVTDVPVTLFGLVSIYFSLEILKTDRWKNYLLSALFIGLAIGTKYNAFTFVIPLIAAHLIKNWSLFNLRLPLELIGKIFSKKLILSIILIPIIFFITTPYALLDLPHFLTDYTAVIASNSRPWNLQLTDANGIPSWRWYLEYSATSGLYYPLFIIVVIGFFWNLLKLTKQKFVIFSYVIVNFIVISLMAGRMDRWVIHIYPYLEMFAAIFLFDLGVFIIKMRSKLIRRAAHLVYAIFILLIFGISIYRVAIYNWSILQKDTRVQATFWIVNNIPINKFIFSVDNSFNYEYLRAKQYSNLRGGVVLGERALKEILSTKEERYILINGGYINSLINYKTSEKSLSPYFDSHSLKELFNYYQILKNKATLITEISNPYFKSGIFGPANLEMSSTVAFWHNPTISIYYLPVESITKKK